MCHNLAGCAFYFCIGIWHNIRQGDVERLLFTELLVEVSFVSTLIKSPMDYVRDGDIQGRFFVFLKAHCPCILPSLT